MKILLDSEPWDMYIYICVLQINAEQIKKIISIQIKIKIKNNLK